MPELRASTITLRHVGLSPLWLFVVAAAIAQSPRSDEALERRIADFRPELPFVESARAFVVDATKRGDSATVRGAIRLVDERRRREPGEWLTAYERLAIVTILPARDILEDSVAIARLLAEESATSGANAYADDHAASLREHLRTSVRRIAGRYDDTGPSDEERRFFNLLINHLHLQGLRGREELAARAESFAGAYPASWRSALVRRHMIGEYQEDRFGLAFSAGYRTANVHGDAGERLEYAHGAVLAGEAYLGSLSGILELVVGVANAPAPFDAGGARWPAGDLPMLSGALLGGYELREGRWSLTPLVGVAMHSFRSEPGDSSASPVRTGFRGGFDVGVMGGYRIAFDAGTHIDLRLRSGVSIISMSGYDERLGGTLLYLQAGFALVYRPYRPRGG